MKTVYIMRHAKSGWGSAGLDDFDRALSQRGRHAADLMGGYFADNGLVPDRVLVSAAIRTRETWQRLAASAALETEPEVSRKFYLADAGTWLAAIRGTGPEHDAVLMIGHNPGVARLVLNLAGTGDPDSVRELRTGYPTGALAQFTFEGTWSDVEAGRGRLVRFVRPRTLE